MALPPDSHTSIVHCTSFLSNLGALHLFTVLVTLHHMLPVPFFLKLLVIVIFCGFNYMYGSHFTRVYSNIDMSYGGDFIRFLQLFHMSFTFSCNAYIYVILSLCFRDISSIPFFSVHLHCVCPSIIIII